MEIVNYLRKGKLYEFFQDMDEEEKPLITVYDKIDSKAFEGGCGGYITIDQKGNVHAWGSSNLLVKLDQVHWNNYKELKKSKFTNLKFA